MDVGSLILPLALLAVLYFLIIRPQQKRQREHRNLVQGLTVGDDVITLGGAHGRVVALTDESMDLEVTDDVIMRFQRSAIARVLKDEPDIPEPSA